MTLNGKRGSNIKYLPHAFTEKGLYMLATVLKSDSAIQATHAIIETYAEVRAIKRELLALHTETDAKKRKSMMQHFGEVLNAPSGRDRPGNTLMIGEPSNDQSGVLSAPSGNVPPSGKLPPIFERDWHDWIVKKDGQLAAFTRYIRENPERAWLRQQNHQYFGNVRKVSFLGREWFAYGNLAILELPVLKAVKGHRATKPGSPEWQALVEDCARYGWTGECWRRGLRQHRGTFRTVVSHHYHDHFLALET